jgi:SHS2 domain-containing protein
LQDLLSELLFRFETAGEVAKEIEFHELGESRLDALMKIANVDRRASVFDREVKAVTYHNIRIENRDGRYEVTIILDI